MKRSLQKVKKYTPSIVAGTICCLLTIGILVLPGKNKGSKAINLSEYSSVNTICESATLRSFYNNVAIYEKKPDGVNSFVDDVLLWPSGGYPQTGYKQFWFEYSGIVETGINANEIVINPPGANGIVDVYVPEAEVLSVYADEDSLTEPISENGWFTTLSRQEKIEAFAAAQNIMRQEAEKDRSLLKRSRENAKILLERYIVNTGKQMGTHFTVRWIDKP